MELLISNQQKPANACCATGESAHHAHATQRGKHE
jgi:hypothetical protein